MNKIVLTLILTLTLGGCAGLYHMPWENVENKNVYSPPVYLQVEKNVAQPVSTVNSATQAKKTVKKPTVVTKTNISNNKVVENATITKPKVISPVAVQQKDVNVDYKSKMIIPVE